MDNKRFPILAGIAVLAIVIAAILLGRRAPEAEGSLVGAPVLPGLAENLNQVERLRFTRAGDQPLTLERGEHGWTVAERGGHPADAAKVRLALINLGETKLLEPKTSNPERYDQLGVQDIDAAGASGALVEISGDGVEHRLIVGNQASGEGTYVRPVGEAASLLATGNLVPDAEVGPWLERTILDIPSSRIQALTLTRGDAAPLRVFKDDPDDSNYTVADVPRGREVTSPYVANGLASMLSGLNLDDVERDREDAHGEAELHRARYELFDGIVIELEGWQEPESPEGNPGQAWARLSAGLDESKAHEQIEASIEAELAAARADAQAAARAAAQAAVDSATTIDRDADPEAEIDLEAAVAEKERTEAVSAVEPEGIAIDVEARRAERLTELQNEVDAINARVQGWLYRVPAFKFSNVNKSMDDMLKPQG